MKFAAKVALADTQKILSLQSWHEKYGWVLCDLIRRLRSSVNRFNYWSTVREIATEQRKLPLVWDVLTRREYLSRVRSITDDVITFEIDELGHCQYSWNRPNYVRFFKPFQHPSIYFIDVPLQWSRFKEARTKILKFKSFLRPDFFETGEFIWYLLHDAQFKSYQTGRVYTEKLIAVLAEFDVINSTLCTLGWPNTLSQLVPQFLWDGPAVCIMNLELTGY